MVNWLVVWNMTCIFHFIKKGCHPSHWRTPSFFRGVGQPPSRLWCAIHYLCIISVYHTLLYSTHPLDQVNGKHSCLFQFPAMISWGTVPQFAMARQLTRMVHDGTIFNHRLIRGAMRFTKPKMPENQRNKPFFWSHHRGSWKGLCAATLTKVRRNFQVVEGRIRIKQYFQELTVLNCCWELRSEQWLCPYSLETFRTKGTTSWVCWVSQSHDCLT